MLFRCQSTSVDPSDPNSLLLQKWHLETKNIRIWPWFHWTFPKTAAPKKKEGHVFIVIALFQGELHEPLMIISCLVHGFVGKTASRCSSIFSAPRHLKVLKWKPYNIDWKKRQEIKQGKHKCKKWMWKAAMLRLRHEGWLLVSWLKRCVLEGKYWYISDFIHFDI